MQFITIILIAISLSMDAFSLALVYGSNDIMEDKIYKLSVVVGMFHFFLPLMGHFLGNGILILLKLSSSILMFIILVSIGIEMVLSSFKDDKKLKYDGVLLFALAVSMDSFSIGLSLVNLVENIFFASLVFSIVSALFTYFGLKLGRYISNKIGGYATIIGGIVLILIALIHIM